MNRAHFHVARSTEDGRWYWHWKHANGRVTDDLAEAHG